MVQVHNRFKIVVRGQQQERGKRELKVIAALAVSLALNLAASPNLAVVDRNLRDLGRDHSQSKRVIVKIINAKKPQLMLKNTKWAQTTPGHRTEDLLPRLMSSRLLPMKQITGRVTR